MKVPLNSQQPTASKLKEKQPQVKEPKSNVVQLGPFYGEANDQFEMINWSEERENGEK